MPRVDSTRSGAGRCERCGGLVPANAPGGLCPRCLLQQGVRLVAGTRAKPGQFVPPAMEELALLFPEFSFVAALGAGGMGAVYKAVQRDLDRTVAIKILPPEAAADPEFTERFRREASALARLDHPNVVRLYDYGQREEFAYFVMEYVDGSDLTRRGTPGAMPMAEALRIVEQLCDALQHSHERGVVHRDIKPANILLTAGGLVKVADFGLARIVQADGDYGLTRTRASMGTPRYMAPEQMESAGQADHRVDVYAVGVVLYELLTGGLPVGHFEAPSEKVTSINTRVDDVVLQALSAEPARRFGGVDELKRRLRDAVANPGPTRRERNRRLAMRALGASLAAALVGAGLGALWLAGTRPDEEASASDREQDALAGSGRPVLTLQSWPMDPAVQTPAPNGVFQSAAWSAAGEDFGAAVLPGGEVIAWGGNRYGQAVPPDGLFDVMQVAVGQGPRSAHALALRRGGQVVGWGDNTFRQCEVPADLPGVVAIAAGELHSLALTVEGRVVAWGTQLSQPATVPEDLPRIKGFAAGAGFSVALASDGAVIVWGDNEYGQCETPDLGAPAIGVAAGWSHVLALLEDGRVTAWGDNRAGQCDVPESAPAAVAVFAGGTGSALVDANGRVTAWGDHPKGIGEAARVQFVGIGAQTWVLAGREQSNP